MVDKLSSPAVELAKAGASIAANLLPAGVGSAFALIKQGGDALAAFVERLNQRRFEEFSKNAYESDVLPENAEDLSAEELVVMLRLCLADVEDEKAALYGCLASSIAAGRVPKELRHPLMTSLSAITHTQAKLLRDAHIAKFHALIPVQGPGVRSQAEYLTGGGSLAQWDLDKLSSVGLVRGNAATDLGHRLVVACYRPNDLTPASIGERAWLSDLAIGLYCYELDDRALVDLSDSISLEARKEGLRMAPAMAPQLERRGLSLRAVLPSFVLLVNKEPQRVIEHLEAVMPARSGAYFPVIVSVGDPTEDLKRAFPDGRFVRVGGDRGATAAAVMATVLQSLGKEEGSSA